MLKRILAIALTLNTCMAAHAASPLSLLSQQCTDYQPRLDKVFMTEDPLEASILLERELIGLFNLKDSVHFYRQYSLTSQEQQALLQCQLHLADEFADLTSSNWIHTQYQRWSTSEDNDLRALSRRVAMLLKEQSTPTQKAKIHTAQASIAHGLKQKDLTLMITDTGCQLTPDEQSHSKGFDQTIASYLILQPDEQCRQGVWQAYQLRAMTRNHAALAQLLSARQAMSLTHGAKDYAHMSLSQQQLADPKLVKRYLDNMTQQTLAPWELGNELSQRPKAAIEPIFTQVMFTRIAEQLSDFDIQFEAVNDKISRVWHHRRLLGELYVSQSDTISVHHLRQTVIGQQFGQVTLSAPQVLSNRTQQIRYIAAVAEVIAQLSKGSHYYLNNTLGYTQDTQVIGQYWLADDLRRQLLPTLPSNSREALLAAYTRQLKVFRSKLALNTYLDSESAIYPNIAKQFTLSFGHHWQRAQDAVYSFSGVASLGPLYYASLWQQSLAELIASDTKLSRNRLFDLLLVNEEQLTIQEQLDLILGAPYSVQDLIERIHYVHTATSH